MLLFLFGCWQTWSVQTNDDCPQPATWFADDDGDGVGNDGYTLVRCAEPDGYVSEGGDCDDTDPDRFPGADEVCDGVDDDCDAVIDEEGTSVYYADADGDGWGDDNDATAGCTPPDGTVAEGGDCDDADAQRHPGADESCDDVDQDCDDTVDEDPVDGGVWYADADQDGFGDAEVRACEQPLGSVERDGDCDDADANVNPGETEVCDNGVDDNCDGSVSPCEWSGDYDALSDAHAWLYGDRASTYHGYSLATGDLDGNGQIEVLAGALNLDGEGYVARVEGPYPDVLDLETDAEHFAGQTGDWAGWSVAVIDADGDAQDDLLVGAWSLEVVYLVHGPVTGGKLAQGEVVTLEGVGYSVAGGDLSDSGPDELILGAPNVGSGGQVWISIGADDEDPAQVQGAATGDSLGDVVLSEDVNGDGVDDLLASGSVGGSVVVFFERPTGVVSAQDADVHIRGEYGFGVALQTGDLDNDGSTDLFVGSPKESYNGSSSGSVFAFLAPVGDLQDNNADRRFDGPTPADEAGVAIAVGHVDNDGQHDVLITSPGFSSDSGVGHLLFSPGTGGTVDLTEADAEFEGSLADGYFGHAALLVDLDADGDADPIFSAPYEYDNAGGVWVFLTPGL